MCQGVFDFIISVTFKGAVDPAVSAAGLLFSQTSKIAETPDRLVSMAEWLIPRYEASKLICAAVLDASVFSFCAPVMCIISEVVPCEHDGQASSKCCLIIKNQILARQTSASTYLAKN